MIRSFGDKETEWLWRGERVHQWRICFVWTDAGPEEVEIGDYH